MSPEAITIRSEKGEAAAFARAHSAAIGSISIPCTRACGNRCANIKAISPVPVPMSRQCCGILPAASSPAHAPSRTPSVPTRMAQPVWSMSNCLKEKISVGIETVRKEEPLFCCILLGFFPLPPSLHPFSQLGFMHCVHLRCPERGVSSFVGQILL